MKIIFTSNMSWSVFNFRKSMMTELRKRGHRVLFCAPRDEYTEKLEAEGFEFIPIDVDRKGTNFFRDLSLIATLYKIYRNEKPGLVFHNSIKPNIYGSIAAKLSGVECVNTVSGLGYIFIRKNIYFYLVKFLYALACRFAKKTFFQNKDDMDLFLSEKIIRPEKAALVRGSGVDIEFFKPEYCKNIKKDSNIFLFTFIGRILWDKGVEEFIDAAKIIRKKYPNTHFDILGMIDKGNPAAVSATEIDNWQKAGLADYLGETSDVRPFICAADCVVLPSYREGIPRSLLEASAMEKPIITTDAAGCREAVEDGITGFMVPARDAAKLAEAMRELMELSSGRRAAMGRAGREKVMKEFNEKQVLDTYFHELGL